jgi:hypothetical protein
MVHDTRTEHEPRGGRIRARLVFTLIGAAALVVGAFLDWTGSLAGTKLTMRSLVQNDFSTTGNVLRSVGAISVLIAAVAVLSLLDPLGWLTRLAGLAAVVLFVMFGIQVYAHNGQNWTATFHALQAGAWLQAAGGLLLLLTGMIRYRRRRVRVVEPALDERVGTAAPDSASAPGATEPVATTAEMRREELEPHSTAFRPPVPEETRVGGRPGQARETDGPTG